jgi:hypothetical protein
MAVRRDHGGEAEIRESRFDKMVLLGGAATQQRNTQEGVNTPMKPSVTDRAQAVKTRAQVIEANLPDPYPNGWRHYAAILGPKWAHLVMLATGEHFKVPTELMRSSRALPDQIVRRAAKRLRRNAKVFGCAHYQYLKEMLAALRD